MPWIYTETFILRELLPAWTNLIAVAIRIAQIAKPVIMIAAVISDDAVSVLGRRSFNFIIADLPISFLSGAGFCCRLMVELFPVMVMRTGKEVIVFALEVFEGSSSDSERRRVYFISYF